MHRRLKNKAHKIVTMWVEFNVLEGWTRVIRSDHRVVQQQNKCTEEYIIEEILNMVVRLATNLNTLIWH